MKPDYKANYYILSGAPGSGKSTIINRLKQRGYICIDEPAREIIAEQRTIDGDGLYDRNKYKFLELMLSRSISKYTLWHDSDSLVIFDRGIPDMIAYAKLFEADTSSSVKASKVYQYNKNVLFLPSWQDIYTNDEDRKMSFEAAKEFGDLIRQAYLDVGYNIIDVPLVDIDVRVHYIIKVLESKK